MLRLTGELSENFLFCAGVAEANLAEKEEEDPVEEEEDPVEEKEEDPVVEEEEEDLVGEDEEEEEEAPLQGLQKTAISDSGSLHETEQPLKGPCTSFSQRRHLCPASPTLQTMQRFFTLLLLMVAWSVLSSELSSAEPLPARELLPLLGLASVRLAAAEEEEEELSSAGPLLGEELLSLLGLASVPSSL